MAIGDDTGTTSFSGNGAEQSFGNSSTHGDMSPQLGLVQGSLNKPCIGLPAKANLGSLVGVVPVAVQDINVLSSPQNQQCVENSTQAKGDEPLAPPERHPGPLGQRYAERLISLRAPRPGRVPGQEVRRGGLQQLRVRHLRGAVGGRRGRDDGAALVHAHRPLGHPDGHRPGRALLEEAVAAGVTTEKADMIFASLPYRIMHEFQIPLYDQMRERDADFYERLEKSGFDHDWGPDGSGLFMKYLRRGSGYYIDVGAADLVADGEVKLAKGQVDHLTEDSVVLADGTALEADLVVYATGYGSMNGWVADLISPSAADQVGKVWGLGSDTPKDPGPWEGEQRNMWKPTRLPALWFHGGNLHQSRHYSLYLALQLKARAEGIPTPVYRLQEVHHLA